MYCGYPLIYYITYFVGIIFRVPYAAIYVCASKRFKKQMDLAQSQIDKLKEDDPNIMEHADCWKDPSDA